jgi:outer membrane protein W
MKSKSFYLLTIAALFSLTAASFAWDNSGKLGISLDGGFILSANGGFNSTDDMSDVVKPGANLGLKVKYNFDNSWAVQCGYDYNFMLVEDDYKPVQSDDPAFVMHAITVDGFYNFGPLLKTNAAAPFVSAGVGIYPWMFTEDGLSGDALPAPNDAAEDFAKTSFGMNFGLGVDYYVVKEWSVNLGVNYRYIFTEDKDKFGDDFENQGLLNCCLGFTYYIPVK